MDSTTRVTGESSGPISMPAAHAAPAEETGMNTAVPNVPTVASSSVTDTAQSSGVPVTAVTAAKWPSVA